MDTFVNSDRINLEELYERKKEIDKLRINIYNNVLHKIHHKIKHTSRLKYNDRFVFYVIPEFILGVPKYNVNECTMYLIDKLSNNGFITKYTYPNLLFISWKHYVPKYKRDEVKKKFGINVDEFGNKTTNIIPKKIEHKPSVTYKDISSIKIDKVFGSK